MEDELQKLRDEQRARLAADIAELKATSAAIQRDVAAIRMEHAKASHVDLLDNRVQQLETDKAKIIGGFVALASLQGVVGFVMWMLHAYTSAPK